MNALVEKLNTLPEQILAAEKEAVRLEVAAKERRNYRQDLKLELSEVQESVNNLKIVVAIESSGKAAQVARVAAEAARTEAQAIVASLTDKETQVDAKLKEMEIELAKVKALTGPVTITDVKVEVHDDDAEAE